MASVDPLFLFGLSSSQSKFDTQSFLQFLRFCFTLLDQDYVGEEFEVLKSQENNEQVARDCQETAIKIVNASLRRIFLSDGRIEPEHLEASQKLRNLLSLPVLDVLIIIGQNELGEIEALLKTAAVKLVLKMCLTERCVK